MLSTLPITKMTLVMGLVTTWKSITSDKYEKTKGY
jgi:hypothetical protein